MVLGTGQLASVLADLAQLDIVWEYSSFVVFPSVLLGNAQLLRPVI